MEPNSDRARLDALRARAAPLLAAAEVRTAARARERLERWWPPRRPGALLQRMRALVRELEDSAERASRRRARLPRIRYPEDLPITARAGEIVDLLRPDRLQEGEPAAAGSLGTGGNPPSNPVIILAGETGSGKSTQLPKMCLAAGLGARGRIACTQPRRLAALSVSRRIADELGLTWGREIGCRIRFTDRTSPETTVKMMTDGMLLAEIQNDPLLLEYEAIIVDEAHERSLNIDFLLGHLRMLRERRPDLRVVITSASIDTEAFAKAFDDAPVVLVSGRSYPVSIRYRPLDILLEAEGEFTYIEGTAKAVEELAAEFPSGDILVFLPGERDILETREALGGRLLGRAEILPLFGRLSNAEQQRIFAPTQRRKIILATNVAETSITVPGIRFVVDSGLARISRYNPNTRTQRLPVEPVSQSSADQRAGRCGRVAEGVCVRLYSEEDYCSRPRFTPPEIRRANLAAVILRMLAFGLGDVERFPFLDPPSERLIRSGYQLLQDLGALDAEKRLTPLGTELARLPVDPTVGRMLLQARREGALAEVLVIASGLSIQDPRERPSEKREAADRAHGRFNHPESDFLTLWNIWNECHEACEKMSQRQLRKFCKAHMLAYSRMREWRDIYEQLGVVLGDLDFPSANAVAAEYHQVHRALLSGLLGAVAQRDSGNRYRATHGRQVRIFPGSTLFDRKAAKGRSHGGKQTPAPAQEASNRTPEWIMAAEWVETSRLFARTCARIDAAWILDLGRGLCKSVFSDPEWNERAGRVLVKERYLLYGLEIGRRNRDYGRINPGDATDFFIRRALVEEAIRESPRFLARNRQVRERWEEKQTRLRRGSVLALDDRVYRFYAERLPPGIASLHDLNRFVRDEKAGDWSFLEMQEEDLDDQTGEERIDPAAFPVGVTLNGRSLSLEYAYKPGEEEDGATLRIPVSEFEAVSAPMLDWVVPGYIEERIACLLRGLPKPLRVQLFPIADKARELAALLEPQPRPLAAILTEAIAERYGVRVRPDDFNEDAVPGHLRPRVLVVDDHGREVAAGRDWNRVAAAYRERVESEIRDGSDAGRLEVWSEACSRFERYELSDWSFGDLPESIEVGRIAGIPVRAYPGLEAVGGSSVNLRLYANRMAAERATESGFPALCEVAMGRDLAWLRKELKQELQRVRIEVGAFAEMESFRQHAWQYVLRELFPAEQRIPLRAAGFRDVLDAAREKQKGMAPRFVDLLAAILAARHEALLCPDPYPGMADQVNELLPPDFLVRYPPDFVQSIPRYLAGYRLRAERRRLDPEKDDRKGARVRPYETAYRELERAADAGGVSRAGVRELRQMLEEFRVSVYAQELGSAFKVSEKRLEAQIRTLREEKG